MIFDKANYSPDKTSKGSLRWKRILMVVKVIFAVGNIAKAADWLIDYLS